MLNVRHSITTTATKFNNASSSRSTTSMTDASGSISSSRFSFMRECYSPFSSRSTVDRTTSFAPSLPFPHLSLQFTRLTEAVQQGYCPSHIFSTTSHSRHQTMACLADPASLVCAFCGIHRSCHRTSVSGRRLCLCSVWRGLYDLLTANNALYLVRPNLAYSISFRALLCSAPIHEL